MTASRLARFVALALLAASPALATTSSITTGFNGTAIPAGRTLWFTSVFKYSGPTSSPVTIDVTGGTITYGSSTISTPNAHITLTSSVTQVTTSYDSGSNTWNTTAPFGTSGNLLLDAVAAPVATSLPGGVHPVTWTANITSNTSGAGINWQFATAVYTSFGSDLSADNVKATDDPNKSAIHNSDHAGTPEAFKSFVTGGAMGGGGANYIGSYSPTASVKFSGSPCAGGDFSCSITGAQFAHTGTTETYTVSSSLPNASVCNWTISGNGGTISGSTQGPSVKVAINGLNGGYGDATLSVTCTSGSCSTTCTLPIKVVPAGVNP